MAHNSHGNNKYLTAKPKSSRQKQKSSRQKQKAHGKTRKLTAKPKSSRQNRKAHGKTKKLTAKPKSSRQNQNSTENQKAHGKNKNSLSGLPVPEHAEEGSSRRKVEESTMDLLQDFLFRLEDDPNVNCSGYAETMASCEDTGKEAAGSKEELLPPDLTPAGVLGWLTGQKHKPISGEQFDHDCLIRNPKHQMCFPVVRACAKEVTFPVAHMKTQEAFNEVLLLALSKGQSFGMA